MHKTLRLLFIVLLAMAFFKAGAVPTNGVKFKNAVIIDPAPYGDFKTLAIPIKRVGNLIIVEAQVDTVEGNFVFDTGAPYLILNATYFRDMPRVSEQQSGGINGSNGDSFTTVVHNFSLLDLHYSQLTADVTDLSAIENGRNIKILGLLGTRLFSTFSITVDLNNNLLYVQKLEKNGEIPAAEQVFHNPFLKTQFSMMNDVMFFKAVVEDKPMWLVFDSGAETNLLDYGKSKKLLDKMQIISRSKLTGIGGSTFEVLYTRFDKLTVADQNFMHNRALVTNLDKMGRAYDHTIDGILGYDFFVRGIFSINFVKKEFAMYIYTNQ